jgi:hypothetical protein
MRIQLLSISTVLAASAVLYGADAVSRPSGSVEAFSRLKSLVGEWEADTRMGKAYLTYELIAGGTALVERERGDKMPEMLTVYHIDGTRLILTHYCAAGNQPRMQAQPYDPAGNEVRFRFVDATNLASPAAGHMHNATIRFIDAGHIESEWQFYENGKPKLTEKAEYTRIR